MEYTKGEWKKAKQWTGDKYNIFTDDEAIASTVSEANAQRIVDCVNGCKGIENPLAVPDMYEALKEMNDGNFLDPDLEAFKALTKAEGR